MADAKRGEDGRLGPYRLGRRHGSKNPELEELGRLYEAHNVHTDASALVLVPAPGVCEEPEEDWKVRVTAQARPPCVAVEVEQAPASGELAGLAGLFEVLTRMMERMEWSDEARRHLTREPEGRLKRWAAGARRVLGWGAQYGIELSVAVLILLLVGAHLLAYIESQRGEQYEAAGVAVQAEEEGRAPTMVDTGRHGSGGHRLSPASKAFQRSGEGAVQVQPARGGVRRRLLVGTRSASAVRGELRRVSRQVLRAGLGALAEAA